MSKSFKGKRDSSGIKGTRGGTEVEEAASLVQVPHRLRLRQHDKLVQELQASKLLVNRHGMSMVSATGHALEVK